MLTPHNGSSPQRATTTQRRHPALVGSLTGAAIVGAALAIYVAGGSPPATAPAAATSAPADLSEPTEAAINNLVSLIATYDTAGVTGEPLPSSQPSEDLVAPVAVDSLAALHAHSTHIHALSETYGAPAVVSSQASLENVTLVERRDTTDVIEFQVAFTRIQGDNLDPHEASKLGSTASRSGAAPLKNSAPSGSSGSVGLGAAPPHSWVTRSAFRVEYDTTSGTTTKIDILDDSIVVANRSFSTGGATIS